MPTWWTELDTWIVVAGALCALSCALLGNYLVLRRMSMMGDAISHAVLPGLAVAFLLTESRGTLPMFIGAVAIGVVTALLVQLLSKSGNLDEGASMGVVFTALFAAGLILIRQAADHVDLDPGCVLYGAIELSPLDTMTLFGFHVPRAVVFNGGVFLLNALFVGVFYKELKLASFDPGLATSLGFNAGALHYALMCMVAVTTVAAFQTVGSILVIAMLIVPAATAYLLTDRLWAMIALSLLLAAGAAVLGHIAAVEVPMAFGIEATSTSGMMSVCAGALFVLGLVFAPRHGLVARATHRARVAFRIACDDILGNLYRADEARPGVADSGKGLAPGAPDHGAVSYRLAILLLTLGRRIDRRPGGFVLADRGRLRAIRLIRSHRLWEGFLVEKAGVKPDHVHSTAERLEHITSETMRLELAREVTRTAVDPHKRPIPDETDVPPR